MNFPVRFFFRQFRKATNARLELEVRERLSHNNVAISAHHINLENRGIVIDEFLQEERKSRKLFLDVFLGPDDTHIVGCQVS